MMLGGDENQIKPDKHIKAFRFDIFHRRVGSDEATEMLKMEAMRMDVSPREVDYSVWIYQRERTRRIP
jgi:hypothetical protein